MWGVHAVYYPRVRVSTPWSGDQRATYLHYVCRMCAAKILEQGTNRSLIRQGSLKLSAGAGHTSFLRSPIRYRRQQFFWNPSFGL